MDLILLWFFFKAACYATSGDERSFTESGSFISRHIFLKFSNTSANNDVSLWTYKPWYYTKFLIWIS